MNIIIEPHTLIRAAERGASKDEIIDVLSNGIFEEAKNLRKSKYKIFDFKNDRNGKYYEQKKIQVIFIIENESIVTVTVYVFYGKWN